jgi:hypothetical protein
MKTVKREIKINNTRRQLQKKVCIDIEIKRSNMRRRVNVHATKNISIFLSARVRCERNETMPFNFFEFAND